MSATLQVLEPATEGLLDEIPRAGVEEADAADLFERSDVARAAFGEDVVAHYLNNARVELAAFYAAVTDWELIRGFERL